MTNLFDIPYEIVREILMYTPIDDLIRFCQTNIYIRRLCNDESFWQRRLINNGITDVELLYKPKNMTWITFVQMWEQRKLVLLPVIEGYYYGQDQTGLLKYMWHDSRNQAKLLEYIWYDMCHQTPNDLCIQLRGRYGQVYVRFYEPGKSIGRGMCRREGGGKASFDQKISSGLIKAIIIDKDKVKYSPWNDWVAMIDAYTN